MGMGIYAIVRMHVGCIRTHVPVRFCRIYGRNEVQFIRTTERSSSVDIRTIIGVRCLRGVADLHVADRRVYRIFVRHARAFLYTRFRSIRAIPYTGKGARMHE